MIDNSVNFVDPPGYVHMETVEEMANHLKKITFPGGFSCYTQSEPDEVELIYNEIMVKQEYFQKGMSIMKSSCVIDIGANIGIFTMAVKLKAPRATVYAFEPIPDTFQVLQQNVRSLGCSDIHLFNVGIGSQDHVDQTFTFFPHMPGNSTSLPALKENQKQWAYQNFGKEKTDYFAQSETRIVKVRTLSSIIREQGITNVDFLKVDVEGSEISVFEGIEEMHWPILKQVVVETHNDHLRDQVYEILVQHGFEVNTDLGLSSPSGDSIVYAHHSQVCT